jgi:hypothetical protein
MKRHHALLPETVVTCHHALLPETVGVMASQGMMALQRHSPGYSALAHNRISECLAPTVKVRRTCEVRRTLLWSL